MLLKHPNNTDVAIEIMKKFYVNEKQLWKMKVRWWNIGQCHAPWDMQLEQKLEIGREEFKEWEVYRD